MNLPDSTCCDAQKHMAPCIDYLCVVVEVGREENEKQEIRVAQSLQDAMPPVVHGGNTFEVEKAAGVFLGEVAVIRELRSARIGRSTSVAQTRKSSNRHSRGLSSNMRGTALSSR